MPLIHHRAFRLQFSLLALILLVCHFALFLALSVFQFVTVPAYFKSFDEQALDLPAATIVVFDVSQIFFHHGYLIFVLLLVVDGGVLLLLDSARSRIIWTCVATAAMASYLALSYLALQMPL